jgi:AraC family transcriptional regulator, transcriptional activator of pobA
LRCEGNGITSIIKMKNQNTPLFQIKDLKCDSLHEADFAIYKFDEFVKDIQHLMPPHKHDFYMLLISFESQDAVHLVDFKNYEITSESIHFIVPGQIHAWTRIGNVEGYLIFFNDKFMLSKSSTELLEKLCVDFELEKQPVRSTSNMTLIRCMVEQIFEEYHQINIHHQLSISYLMQLLLIEIDRLKIQDFSFDASYQGVNILRAYKTLIAKNFTTIKSVSQYANLLNISANYLNEISVSKTGKSAGSHIKVRIILEAKRAIIHHQKNISEIGYDLGFEDKSYFSKFFKKNTGLTPEEFRNSYLIKLKNYHRNQVLLN